MIQTFNKSLIRPFTSKLVDDATQSQRGDIIKKKENMAADWLSMFAAERI